MLGNDVVDLRDPETAPDALHPGFDRRVFAAVERERLRRSPRPERQRWIHWAAKEAAYKALRRCDATVIFSPRRFVVESAGRTRGSVRLGERVLEVDFTVTNDAVHAIARPRHVPPAEIVAGVADLSDRDRVTPSAAVREACLRALRLRLGLAHEHLEIRREGRVPRLWIRSRDAGEWRQAAFPVSLSHHGRFVAFACALLRDPQAPAHAVRSVH
jgi:phosphopantetheinyl transferase (holo-ACP synthase)